MHKPLIKRLGLLSPVFFLSFLLFSCNSTKKIKYFQDIPDSGKLQTIPTAVYNEPKIKVDDILSVIVQTIDPIATQSINAGNLSASASSMASLTANSNPMNVSASNQSSFGYLVDKEGYIDISILGKIHVAGYTTFEAKDTIYKLALKYYHNPTVSVRFANFKVNIAGEVLKPGQYVLPNEKVSILDALTMAGDLTVFGKRENVLLVRDNEDGTKTPYRINLKKSDVMMSPAYYLKQNDYIYVEPRKAKSDATDAAQTKYIGIATAIVSILIILASRR